MVYLFFLFYSQACLYFLGKYSTKLHQYYLLLTPIILLWVIIVGGQYNVGTDYFSYMKLFVGRESLFRYIDNGEFLFVFLIRFCHYIGIYGQGIFIVIGFIEVILYFYISKLIVSNKNTWVLFVVFMCFSTIFNNQMNGIRQYFAMYFFTLSVLEMLNRKYVVMSVLILASVLIHKSALLLSLFLILFFFLKNIRTSKKLYIFIIIGLIISAIPLYNSFIGFIVEYSFYDGYVENGYIQEVGINDKLIKYAFVPVFMYSIGKVKFLKLSCFHRYLFVIGIISFSVRLMALNLSLTNRFGMYFEFLMCIPLVYLIITLKRKSTFIFLSLLLFLYMIYTLKVTLFAKGEYLYNSYFFN